MTQPIDYMDEFVAAVKKDLERGQLKWGNTWKHLPRKGQEQRMGDYIQYYFLRNAETGAAVPWESVAGNALIGWIREHHPEALQEGPNE